MRRLDRGSLALEQVLFIAAIVVLGAAVSSFYGKLGNYFNTVQIPTVGATSNTSN
jgi:hypothetical protein